MVMAIEEGFGVRIADAEAEACVTPAAVIDLVFGKLRASDDREDAHFVKDLGMG